MNSLTLNAPPSHAVYTRRFDRPGQLRKTVGMALCCLILTAATFAHSQRYTALAALHCSGLTHDPLPRLSRSIYQASYRR
ncbi:MAG: hypothetical protein R3E79_08400 [Caldilineaceae bacterium]